MIQRFLKILTIVFTYLVNPAYTQVIWQENFSVPEKGIQGDETGGIISDFSGITQWNLEYHDISLDNPGDYAKTISTSGGRFEACDIDGEVIWYSEWIDISSCEKVMVELTASETGSGANQTTKYLKAFFQLDHKQEVPFHKNHESKGNWGSNPVVAEGLKGESLRIICRISTHYSSDKVILDNLMVISDIGPLPPVKPFDIVINELMPDPYPPVELPNAEFIELLNNSNYPVCTKNWKLRINHISKNIQSNWIAPGECLLLCATGALNELKPYGQASNVVGFQGLPNRGAQIDILDEKGNLIDHIEYSSTWYDHHEKENGGWSLERIDPFRHCHQKENWQASQHPDGGTPGTSNSVMANNPDLISPWIKWAVPVSDNELELLFSEPLDILKLQEKENYSLGILGNPDKIILSSATKINLHFKKSFQENKIYTLEIFNLTDECSNPLFQNHCKIQRNNIEPYDILINELLFNPFPGGKDYVEIYNPSAKLIDMSRLLLATRDKQLQPDRVSKLTNQRKIWKPKCYLALTTDTHAVFPWFFIPDTCNFLQLEQMPPFPNTEGYVLLLNEKMQIIDEFYYQEKMHSPFLGDVEGIALERVSFTSNTNAPGNWQSASAWSGYGTPGYENSQAASEATGKPQITFIPEAFSPNQDGFKDNYIIRYKLGKSGFVANIKIFDASGRFVQHLAKNEILGTFGEFIWNGEDETGSRLQPGVYVVTMEIFHANGEIHRFKDGVVLTEKW
ncbi:MAG: lamin tail domain-containing protein [Mariniphaga sp.]